MRNGTNSGIRTVFASPAALLVLGWVLLTTAWTIGNPPFAAPPDEADHYLRTLAGSPRAISWGGPPRRSAR